MGDQNKFGKDPFDGRITYQADVGEVLELEVEKNHYERFTCTEGRDCKHCDLNYLSFDFCINFPCLAQDRTDGQDVHFVWRKDA